MTDISADSIMSGYIFKTYAFRAAAGYIPSLVGSPIDGVGAQVAYYERIELPSRHITALGKTQYVVEGSDDPILQARHAKGTIFVIPASELADIAAAHQDDELWAMLRRLLKGRVF